MTEHQGSAAVRRVGLASLMGTTIEYYDFFIYGTAAALVFGEVFFPAQDPLIGTLLAFATFGVAFVARPIGGFVFGHYGDKIGRKTALVITLLTMGVATVGVGLVPSYDSIGIAAPIILVLLRLIQGFALGGEYGGAVLMTVEHSPSDRRGFYGSWVQTGAQFGLIIANVVFLIVGSAVGDEAFKTWGWRVPFWISLVLVVLGLVIRLKLEESPEFRALKEGNATHAAPMLVVLREHLLEVLLIAGAAVSFSVTFYATAVFGLSYGTTQGLTRNELLVVVITSAAWVIVVSIGAGTLSDRIGRKPLFLAGCAIVTVLAYPWVVSLQSGEMATAMLGYLAILTGYALTWGTIGVMFAEAFQGDVRYTGLSAGYTIGVIIGGAVTPIVLTKLVASYSSPMPVVLWVAGAAVLSGLCSLPMRKAPTTATSRPSTALHSTEANR
jgi:MFS family permease